MWSNNKIIEVSGFKRRRETAVATDRIMKCHIYIRDRFYSIFSDTISFNMDESQMWKTRGLVHFSHYEQTSLYAVFLFSTETYPPTYSHLWSFLMRIRYMRGLFFGFYPSHVTRSACIFLLINISWCGLTGIKSEKFFMEMETKLRSSLRQAKIICCCL